MKYQRWKDAIELAGIVAIVASLIFVGLQMRQEREIAKNEGDLSILSSAIEVRNAFNDHADIWVKANSGNDLNDAEAFIFSNLVHSINISSFFNYERAVRLKGGDVAAVILHDFAAILYQYPAVRAEWVAQEENTVRYREILAGGNMFSYWINGIKSDLAKLDETGSR